MYRRILVPVDGSKASLKGLDEAIKWSKAFGAQLHRPTLLPIPKVAIQALYGAFAEEAFRSIRARSTALNSAGYVFRHRTVSAALAASFPTRID